MNCPECLDLLQQRLDGVPQGAPSELDRHLAGCPDCRAQHAAAGRLEAGLRLLPAVTPPGDLAGRIAGEVFAERRALRRRRGGLAAGAALAASMLLVFLLGRGRTHVDTPPVAEAGKSPAASTTPQDEESLRDSVSEAGSAMVDLTRRTADETVAQGKLLLPVVAQPNLGEGASQAMGPPVRSLQAAGQGVSEGLEPVTRSARRAFDLFLSELPPIDSGDKQGL
jgi:predicted anti-sigma-YlaC factor YlaD